MNTKKVFSKRLALSLRKEGCRIIKTEPNNYKPQFEVYIFEDNEHLRECLTKLTQA